MSDAFLIFFQSIFVSVAAASFLACCLGPAQVSHDAPQSESVGLQIFAYTKHNKNKCSAGAGVIQPPESEDFALYHARSKRVANYLWLVSITPTSLLWVLDLCEAARRRLRRMMVG